MQLSVTFENNEREKTGNGPAVVGWLLASDRAGIIYDPPSRVRSAELNKSHVKSASRCPAIINLESRYFEIRCPFDLSLQFVRDNKGNPNINNLLGDQSPVRNKKLSEIIHLTAEKEWRYKDRPTLQVMLPYIFISDEPVYMAQVSPFMHYRAEPMPGTIFGGRYPINVWPRPLMWAFEWHDASKPLNLKRGEPLFYVQFETMPQDRAVQVVETKRTPELTEYLDLVSESVNYVNQTFSLFKAAEERRPSHLVEPIVRK